MAQDPATPPADVEAELTLDDVRARVRAELIGVALNPVEAELEAHDVLALADAYVRLGGDLELTAPTPPPRFNPADVKLRELLRGAAWQAANDAGAEAATADTIAAKVAEALEELAR